MIKRMDEKLQLAKEMVEQMFRIADHYRRLCGDYELKIAELEKEGKEKDAVIEQQKKNLTDNDTIIQYLKSILDSTGKDGDISKSVMKAHSEAMKMMGQLLNKGIKVKKAGKGRKIKSCVANAYAADTCETDTYEAKERGAGAHKAGKCRQADSEPVHDSTNASKGRDSEIVKWQEE